MTLYFLATLTVSFFLTAAVRGLMRRFRIVDIPKTQKRKIHKKKIPLGGGLAIFVTYFSFVALAYGVGSIGEVIPARMMLYVFLAGAVLMIGGLIDDAKTLRPWQQIWFPVIAAGIIAFAGIGPSEITNPLGGTIILGTAVINRPSSF